MGFQKNYVFLVTLLANIVLSTAGNPMIIEEGPVYFEHILGYEGVFAFEDSITIIEDEPGYTENKTEYEMFLMAVAKSRNDNANIKKKLELLEQAYKDNDIFLDMDVKLFFEIKLHLREELDNIYTNILNLINEFQKTFINILMLLVNNANDTNFSDFYKLYKEQNNELEETRDILILKK